MAGHVYYNKLIRDNIEAKIRAKGENCEVRAITDDQEFEQELLKKVTEEASALSKVRTKEEFLDELADLMAVIDTLRALQGVSDTDLAEARTKNESKKGGFEKRLFLHWSDDSDYKSNETPQGVKS